MTTTQARADRPQTIEEEIANALSHGVGFLLAAASLPVLVAMAERQHGSTMHVVAVSVFSITMMLLYLASAAYHAAPEGDFKAFLNRLDHAAIFLFIAGSYTPFALGVLDGRWGWMLFGGIWAMSAAGVAVKLLDRLKHPLWSTALYVALGWFALVAAMPTLRTMSTDGILWLLAGGVAYTAGAIVFLFDSRARFLHFVWHLFVLGGTACHFWAALWYVLPSQAA
ncbi:MAG TPA: hemolysin III family protein [Burkholderiaceae bacterium]|nr:hemolysin III family protein [Burkholderiaceae bacterium]